MVDGLSVCPTFTRPDSQPSDAASVVAEDGTFICRSVLPFLRHDHLCEAHHTDEGLFDLLPFRLTQRGLLLSTYSPYPRAESHVDTFACCAVMVAHLL